MKKYILSIDQGTTSSRVLLVNKKAEIVYKDYIELEQIKLTNNKILQDASEILKSVRILIERLFKNFNVRPEEIDSVAISNQRETTIIWDKRTGRPISEAISWQATHTALLTNKWIEMGLSDLVFKKTGLLINPYFSASKIVELLSEAKEDISNLMFGTVDSFLVYNLSIEKNHLTCVTNASRTMIYNISENKWDLDLLKAFNIPASILPKVVSNDYLFGHLKIDNVLIPIRSVIGDQQGALFGHLCTLVGETKVTYGTGSFILTNLGENLVYTDHGLITTIAYKLEDGPTNYALEGSVFMAGDALKWMREKLLLLNHASDSEAMARQAKNDDIFVVPAFTGLGSPHWNSDVRGAILGLASNTTKEDIIKATLNSIAYQVMDVLKVIERDGNISISNIKVDGGASSNNYLMKLQADLSNSLIIQNKESEITGLGAAFIAGLKTNFFVSIEDLRRKFKIKRIFNPSANNKQVISNYEKWQRAVKMLIELK